MSAAAERPEAPRRAAIALDAGVRAGAARARGDRGRERRRPEGGGTPRARGARDAGSRSSCGCGTRSAISRRACSGDRARAARCWVAVIGAAARRPATRRSRACRCSRSWWRCSAPSRSLGARRDVRGARGGDAPRRTIAGSELVVEAAACVRGGAELICCARARSPSSSIERHPLPTRARSRPRARSRSRSATWKRAKTVACAPALAAWDVAARRHQRRVRVHARRSRRPRLRSSCAPGREPRAHAFATQTREPTAAARRRRSRPIDKARHAKAVAPDSATPSALGPITKAALLGVPARGATLAPAEAAAALGARRGLGRAWRQAVRAAASRSRRRSPALVEAGARSAGGDPGAGHADWPARATGKLDDNHEDGARGLRELSRSRSACALEDRATARSSRQHPGRAMASDQALRGRARPGGCGRALDRRRRRRADRRSSLEMLWEVAPQLAPTPQSALFEADASDAKRLAATSDAAAAAMYPQIAKLLGGPAVLLHAAPRGGGKPSRGKRVPRSRRPR